MKKSFNKIITLLLCAVMLFIMIGAVACDGGDTPPEPPVTTIQVGFEKNFSGSNPTVLNFPDPDVFRINSGSKMTKPSVDPEINGYTFGGWYAEAECINEFDFNTSITKDKTFVFAKWTLYIAMSDVTFDLNYDAAEEPEVVPVETGKTVEQPEEPTRDGYEFDGWSLSKTGAGGLYSFSAVVNASIHLYAVWTELLTVTFSYNYAGSPAAHEFTVRKGESISLFTPETRDGWTFDGWYKEVSYETEYEFGAVTASGTVYAKWVEIVTYTVSYNLNYPEAPEPPAPQTITDGMFTKPTNPQRAGYDFDGWYTQATGGSQFNFNAPVMQSRTLYARWTELLTITFNFSLVGVSNQTQTVRYNLAANVESITLPTHPDGWVIAGWYADSALQTEYEFSPMTASITVYAKWVDLNVQDEFTVSFDLNYPDAPQPPAPQTVTGTPINKPADPVRDGYYFEGWYTQAAGGALYNFGSTVTRDRTLYARWTKLWTITFDFNLTGVDAAKQSIREGSSANSLTIVIPGHPQGWALVGWYNEAACINEYDFEAVIANKTIYAKWAQTSANVTFDLNYAGAPEATVVVVQLGSSATPPATPVRSGGYTFAGWYTSASGSTLYNFGAVTADRTVYARWNVTVTLNLNYSGAPTIAAKTYLEGTTLPAPDVPTRAADTATGNGFTFLGWSTAPNISPNFQGVGSPITSSTTLYAQWKHKYVFEAEYTYLDDLEGQSVSGVAVGPAMIIKELDYGNPVEYPQAAFSNGFAVSYLYGYGLALTFDVKSDRSAEVDLYVRLSGEFTDQEFADEMYTIEVNGKAAGFLDMTIEHETFIRPCKEAMFKVNLNEGDNRIRLITTNSIPLGGTMSSHAPIVDCIKIETVAKMSMFTVDTIGEYAGRRLEGPRYSNLDGKI